MAVQRELDGGAITLRGRVGDSGCQHAGGTETPTRGPIADSTESLWNVTAACRAACYTVPLVYGLERLPERVAHTRGKIGPHLAIRSRTLRFFVPELLSPGLRSRVGRPLSFEGLAPFSSEVQAILARVKDNQSFGEAVLKLFFASTDTSQAAGRAFLERLGARSEDREPPSGDQIARAQLAAIQTWATSNGDRFARLREIKQPVLVVNGSNDIMVPTVNSFHLAQNLLTHC